MSILIKGMKKPDHCLRCPMMRSDSENDWCPFQGYNNEADSWEKLMTNCPLVEIPEPHGRLIDADKLCEYACNSTVGIDANDICRFPCVIEAEEQEHDREDAKTYSKNYPCYLDYPLREEQENG